MNDVKTIFLFLFASRISILSYFDPFLPKGQTSGSKEQTLIEFILTKKASNDII